MQKLQDHGGSGVVTIPKDWLEQDGIIEDGEIPDEQAVLVDRLDEGTYTVRFADGGEIPEIEESKAIQGIVAQEVLMREEQRNSNPSSRSNGPLSAD